MEKTIIRANGTFNLTFNNSYFYDVYWQYDYDELPCMFSPDYKNGTTSSMLRSSPSYNLLFKVLLPIICVSGIVGIILTVMVLSRKNMCTSTNCYLTSLSIADLGFLVILSTKFLEYRITGYPFHVFDIYFTYAQIFLHTFLLASVWLTVMLAIERYIAICHPLRAISICTVRRARIIIVVIFVFSFYCRVPNFFEQEIKTVTPCPGYPEFRHMVLTKLGQNLTYKISYAWVVDCIICAILPFIALLFLNIRLIIEIRKSTKYLRYHLGTDSNMQNAVSNEQLKITMMLISIIFVFFVCQAPYVITMAYRNIHQYTSRTILRSLTMEIVADATIFMLALKSAINFILYCWFSEKFWNTFKRAFFIRYCLRLYKTRRHNGHTVHSADQTGSHSARKASCMTKDTIC
ncbi:FMRFamide receptor-like [Mizuhopecten yessoensis]|uniref:FMRFamide receptor n=1 Tax=Mizuhopecten yessoensis TaxID=6573 RepID=A0A210PPP6_MIZYE|nr:FMRFamide receptor-like [Mizuhopecten yessoensis]XP_021378359.1 FMRFamide receptor-like [Mizuhopecten yessoensis]XP_021378360.1 FMRFamide receptor-like [Mizuhopecten yessoensis]XP_021378361.1 FMRFamide receptor-like [Mizuhopecten yessoensis]XP_021378362.1 FMRFamide receptor-like [Mizuhopecten yessoensis]OWF38453.1 FMRFamide receptor [Mizuhopecten yessoensis]